MNVPGKLSAQQVEQMIELREKGWGYDRLAAHFSVSSAAVHYQCLRHGAISPHQRRYPRLPYAVGRPEFTARDGRTQRRFSPSEDAQLLELALQGKGNAEIARIMNRPRTSTRIRLLTLAQHDELAFGDADE